MRLLAALVLVTVTWGCGAHRPKPASYGEALLICVARAKTLAESQSCRCDVSQAYGRACDEVP